MSIAKFMLTPYVDRVNIKLCSTCKHFDAPVVKCTRFGRLNLTNGDVVYMDALMCREYDNFCGNEAKFHEDKDVDTITNNEPLRNTWSI